MAVSGPLDEGQVAPEDIGAMLRNAREAAGYSIADVAQRLRLSRHHIENLEAERFDLFPVSVFLRGYLTSYARLLGIDSEPLLEAYDRRGFGPPQLHSQDSDRSTGRGSEFTVTITTLIVIAVLIVLSALWWREQWNEDDVTTGSTVEQTDRDDLSAGVESGLGESDEFRIPFGGAVSDEPPAQEEAIGSAEVSEAPADQEDLDVPGIVGEEATPAGGQASGAVDEGDSGTVSASEEPLATVPVPEPEPESPAEQGPATAQPGEPAAVEAPGGQSSIVIRVKEDCWLMVRDAEQRLIYRDLAAAGTVLELSGRAPVRVVVGYAHGIEIDFNGVPFDLTPYIEQETGTARFRLGA
ncbi:MAG: DUF4115 domain-containing protein [Immundisolibacterales bacterium]|nr:DUF4115 domain-containing protein [Immundisolibacterales bacterium]